LDQRADEALPELQGHGREKIKIRNLLLHNSGLPASFRPDQLGDVRSALASQELVYETETDTIYSDVGFIALGWILERLSGKPLPQLFQERIFLPLGMTQTGFCPPPKLRAQCAPTEFRDGETIQGRVHDPTAAAMAGVAGHAGLFSTIGDMARFGAEQLVGGRRLFSPETFADFTGDCPAINGRLLGWQAASPGSNAGNRLDPHSFGHTGFTGTSIWVDLAANLFVVLLTNRTYPTAENLKIRDFRIAFHDAAFDEFGNTPQQV
jgi:CubicO group peptidase (beta-lactamase class C family)